MYIIQMRFVIENFQEAYKRVKLHSSLGYRQPRLCINGTLTSSG